MSIHLQNKGDYRLVLEMSCHKTEHDRLQSRGLLQLIRISRVEGWNLPNEERFETIAGTGSAACRYSKVLNDVKEFSIENSDLKKLTGNQNLPLRWFLLLTEFH